MNAPATLSRITSLRLVPIVRAASETGAVQAVEAIHRAGAGIAEIALTTPGGLRAIEILAARYGDKILLGAGTVLDPASARAAILAGAEFLVTPSLSRETIEVAKRYSKAIFPGALTPTEVLTAWEAGADAVKIFPCGNVGGPKYIRALKGPFPHIAMVPTGGVNLETTPEFLKAGACAVAVGSELVDAKLIREARFDEIENRARRFLAAASAG